MKNNSKHHFTVEDKSLYRKLCGSGDANIRYIESITGTSLIARGNELIIQGEDEVSVKVLKILHLLSDHLHKKDAAYELREFDLKYLSQSIMEGEDIKAEDLNSLKVTIPDTGKSVMPKTMNQAKYMHSINKNALTFGIGPAGTGKTYLAVAMALHYFSKGLVERIILTRPAVEAGENLGFLPGDLVQKINPYLRPLYDAMFELMTFEKVSKHIESGQIEIAPLAYMRGRTLNNAFIILDEAQNTTTTQMKMFLTRLGVNSKFVISGDITQIDLEKNKKSGLVNAHKLLKSIEGIEFVQFNKKDISRHPIVEKIVAAYEKNIKTD